MRTGLIYRKSLGRACHRQGFSDARFDPGMIFESGHQQWAQCALQLTYLLVHAYTVRNPDPYVYERPPTLANICKKVRNAFRCPGEQIAPFRQAQRLLLDDGVLGAPLRCVVRWHHSDVQKFQGGPGLGAGAVATTSFDGLLNLERGSVDRRINAYRKT